MSSNLNGVGNEFRIFNDKDLKSIEKEVNASYLNFKLDPNSESNSDISLNQLTKNLADEKVKEAKSDIMSEIEELYKELSETTASVKRQQISDKIAYKRAESNPDISSEIAELYKELSETTDSGKREYLLDKIKHVEMEQKDNNLKQEREPLNSQSNLPDDVKDKFTNLYEKLAETTDYAMRQSIMDEITYLEKQHINNKEEKDINDRQKEIALELSRGTELKDLYQKMSVTTDLQVRNAISCKIKQVEIEQNDDKLKQEREFLNSKSRLPDDVKDKFATLYEKLAETTDHAMRQSIMDEITYLEKQHINNQEEKDINDRQKAIASELSKDSELKDLYDELSIVTDPAKSQQITDKILSVLNGKISVEDLGNSAKTWGQKYKSKHQKELEAVEEAEKIIDRPTPHFKFLDNE